MDSKSYNRIQRWKRKKKPYPTLTDKSHPQSIQNAFTEYQYILKLFPNDNIETITRNKILLAVYTDQFNELAKEKYLEDLRKKKD